MNTHREIPRDESWGDPTEIDLLNEKHRLESEGQELPPTLEDLYRKEEKLSRQLDTASEADIALIDKELVEVQQKIKEMESALEEEPAAR